MKSNSQKEEELERIANIADYISLGDIGNNLIRKQGNWSLLPNMGFLSSVAPATLNKGFLPFPKFPEWFGKMSTTKKTMRQLREIRAAIGLKLYATESVIYHDYIPLLYKMILTYLQNDNINVHIYIYIYIYIYI